MIAAVVSPLWSGISSEHANIDKRRRCYERARGRGGEGATRRSGGTVGRRPPEARRGDTATRRHGEGRSGHGWQATAQGATRRHGDAATRRRAFGGRGWQATAQGATRRHGDAATRRQVFRARLAGDRPRRDAATRRHGDAATGVRGRGWQATAQGATRRHGDAATRRQVFRARLAGDRPRRDAATRRRGDTATGVQGEVGRRKRLPHHACPTTQYSD